MSKQAVERLFTLIEALANSSLGLTREELRWSISAYREATSDQAFERMFERDKASLRYLNYLADSSGSTRSADGYRYRLNAVLRDQDSVSQKVTSAEVESAPLVVAWAAQMFTDGDLQKIAESAVAKMGWTRSGAEKLFQVQTNNFSADALLELTLRSVAEKLELHFGYVGARQQSHNKKVIYPVGLGSRFGRWYVAGYYPESSTLRTFRLDRMYEVTMGSEFSQVYEPVVMERVLQGISEAKPLALATVRYTRDGGEWKSESAVTASYSLWESVASANISGIVISREVGEQRVPEGVVYDSEYQQRASVAQQTVLDVVAQEHEGQRPVSSLPTVFAKPSYPRVRAKAEGVALQVLAIAQVALENPGISLQDLATRFNISVREVKNRLNILWLNMGEQNVHLEVDRQSVLLSSRLQLLPEVEFTSLEVATLVLALEQLRLTSADDQLIDAAETYVLARSLEGKNIAQRIAIFESDSSVKLIRHAIERKNSLRIIYENHQCMTDRVIVPQEIFIRDGFYYVAAFCVLRKAARVFRVDRIQKIISFSDSLSSGGEEQSTNRPKLSLMDANSSEDSPVLLVSTPQEFSDYTAWYLRHLSQEIASDGSRTYWRIPVRQYAWAVELVMGSNGEIRVEEPAELRTRVYKHVSTLQEQRNHDQYTQDNKRQED